MDSYHYVDLFATKGIEYIFILGFLAVLVWYWRYLNKPVVSAAKAAHTKIKTTLIDWFNLANDFYYHQGHTWAVPEKEGVLRVGIDDFAQKLVGKPSAIELPKVGEQLVQGDVGWKMKVDSKTIDVLSPANGEVIAVNERVLQSPDLINEDPYKNGWLLKIKTPQMKANLKNLLNGNMARAWMEYTTHQISQTLSDDAVPVLQDGGKIVPGFAKEIEPKNWDKLARHFLLTDD